MFNEGESHKKLKEATKEIFLKDYQIIEEGKFWNKRIDLILLKENKIVGFVECIQTQGIKNAKRKLVQLPDSVRKIIVRYKREKNPKARKIIEQLKEFKIEFKEI